MDALRGEDPRHAGDFVLVARLGSGGMGEVFLGRSPQGRTAAVKLVQPELARDPEFRRRFRLEVAATRKVASPWTASVLAADTESPRPWVATSFVPGLTLTEAVETAGPLPERAVLRIAHGLVHALRDIHAAGLVHRDLKPSNVMLTLDGPTVIDFGIVRAADSSVVTRAGAIVGSPGFMSPEQARGLEAASPSDVFSMGCVLAFAGTGRAPFGSATDSGVPAVLLRVVSEEADLTGLPGSLLSLVAACLAKSPAERPTLVELGEAPAIRSMAAPGHAEWLPAALTSSVARRVTRALDLETPKPPAPPVSQTPTAVPLHDAATVTGATPPSAPPQSSRAPVRGTVGVDPVSRAGRARRPALLTGSVLAVALLAVVLTIIVPGLGEDQPSAEPAPQQSTSGPATPAATPEPTPAGVVPPAFLGAWRGTITGDQERLMTIAQGHIGSTVVVTRTISSDTKCRGTGTLVSAGESAIELDTVVTESIPEGGCVSIGGQRLTRIDDDHLRWDAASGTGILTRQ
ncbi:serine/threonine-protein kinase [Kitasatospora purpeofusca]|uniref:serine/threonine-protein kinase n=1 Tax=Kitasatospora purpeofusca TaxID=67352 RepID=UPI00068C50F6|nr:serine/threonine-protein kinase [Kitasatospora purpeofusca]